MAKSNPKPAAKTPPSDRQILYNKKLRHDHAIIDTYEAGIVLSGSEAKSLRNGDVQWGDAHARFDERTGELFLFSLHIGEYRQAGVFGHQPQQPRKLLLSRKELDRMAVAMAGKGLTIIPEELLFRRGYAKVSICLCKGKDRKDKRQDLMKRAQNRDVDREMARRAKRG